MYYRSSINFNHESDSLDQWSPTFSVPRAGLMSDNIFMAQSKGVVDKNKMKW